jgi:uncharacterized protein (DUF488 family)
MGMANTLYTIGYEETSAQSFLEKLESAGVQMVLDVRELPQSRIPGFSKNALSEKPGHKGIDYLHVRELGSPRKLRHELRETNDFMAFTRGYLLYIRTQKERVRTVTDMAYEKTCCLLCFEKIMKERLNSRAASNDCLKLAA